MSELTHIKNIIKEKTIILEGADRATQKGFTQVPNFVLESKEISTGGKLTYAMLLKYAWQNEFCFPGQERLGEDMGVTLPSANRYLKELESKGFIRVKRRGQGKTNKYFLKFTVK